MSKDTNFRRFSEEERARTIIIPTSITPDENREYATKWRVYPKLSRSGKSTIIVCPTHEEAKSILQEIKETHPSAELSQDKKEYSVIFPVRDPTHAQDIATLIPDTISTAVWNSDSNKTLIFATYKQIKHVIYALNNKEPPHEQLDTPFLSNQTRDDLKPHRLIFLHSIPKTQDELNGYNNDITKNLNNIISHDINVSGILNKGCTFVLFENLEDINTLKNNTVDNRLAGQIEHYAFKTTDEMASEMEGKRRNTNNNNNNSDTLSTGSSSSSHSFSSRSSSSSSQATFTAHTNKQNETSFIINIPHLSPIPSPSNSNALVPVNSDELAVSTKQAINPLINQLQNSIMGAITSMSDELTIRREQLNNINNGIANVTELVSREAENTRKHCRDDSIALMEEVKALRTTVDAQITLLASLADGIKGYHNDNTTLINSLNQQAPVQTPQESRPKRSTKH